MAITAKIKFDRDFNILVNSKKDFTCVRSGSYVYLNYDDKKVQYAPDDHGGISGAHLSNMVKNDVDKLVVIPEDVTSVGYEPISVYVSQDEIDKMCGQYIYQMDIRHCYWKTAFRQGIISYSTYLKGLRKKDWKSGRNASIGSLDKKTMIQYYEKGQLVETERHVNPPHFVYARKMVLDAVDNFAMKAIKDVLKDDFLFFITDCFFIKSGPAINRLQDYFYEHKYEWQAATVFLKDHVAKEKLIIWDKIEEKKSSKFPGKKKIEYQADKYIHYTSKSIL